jgi:hypothetical protein
MDRRLLEIGAVEAVRLNQPLMFMVHSIRANGTSLDGAPPHFGRGFYGGFWLWFI